MSWKDAKIAVIGKPTPDDSLELRNSFIENVMRDEEGNKVIQAEIHQEIQSTLWEWEQDGHNKGIISAPYGSGKSQQLPIGLGTYFSTLKPEHMHLLITASPALSKKRIKAIRMLVESEPYKKWCRDHNFKPLTYARSDSYSSEQIYFASENTTGNPSFEAHGIDTGGTGMRATMLWGDDICDKKDFESEAVRTSRFNSWTNTWSKRLMQGGKVFMIRTPYHPNDANERLIKSGVYNHLEIAVREDKTGYDLKEWRVDV